MGFYGNSMSNMSRNCQTEVQSASIILHSHHQAMRVRVSPQLGIFEMVVMLAGMERLSRCGFDWNLLPG